MPSDLLPPIDALITALAVVFALSVVVGLTLGWARLRRPRPTSRVDGTSETGPQAPHATNDPAVTTRPPHGRLLSRRWRIGREKPV
jgi:hypothetical protein